MPGTDRGFCREGYERLANEIIVLAAKDYRRVLKRLKRHPNSRMVGAEAEELEGFFRSDWYRTLTDVDGELIIKGLREEAGI